MQLLQTEVFEKDVKNLDGSIRLRLKKTIQKIIDNPELGKPLKHLVGVFSERVENFRLIYSIKNDEMLLLCFKNRNEVYSYLEKISG